MDKTLSLIESILYMANSPVNISDISDFLDITYVQALEYILELQRLRNDTGINIKINDNEVMLSTNAEFGDKLNQYFNIEVKKRRLTESNMEVLAIIAYKGKVTKSEIEAIRKVSADASIATLVDKKLIYSKERKKVQGNPKLYELTDDFYKYLGLSDKDEIENILIKKEDLDENK